MSKEKLKIGTIESFAIVVVGLLLIMFIYNGVRISGLNTSGGAIIGLVSASEIMPTGVPKIYGKELGVNFDEVSESNPQGANANIAILSDLDKSITLQGEDLQRYISVVSQISCEFCCGANSIIRSDGSSACGCAHSYAMRGLGKYLITEHGSEYSDDEILSELGKWKVLFFPGIHESKAAIMESQGIDVNYISLASNENRGIEKGAPAGGGGMVGGC